MHLRRLSAAFISVALGGLGAAGCEDKTVTEEKKVTTQTEVNDRLLGGKEVKEKQVIQQGDKIQVKEKETEIDSKGRVEEKKTTITGDKIE